jgi:hypothetical protein
MERKLRDLQRLLDGQAPITRLDLERANRSGLIAGVFVGLLTSLASSLLCGWLRRRAPVRPPPGA